MDIKKLNHKTIEALRDLAIEYENSNLQVAKELMHLAYIARPRGPIIKKKFNKYNEKLNSISPEEIKLNEMIAKGELAIIPIGFRCYTKQFIRKYLKIKQKSLPFDSGFFPVSSIISVLNEPIINLKFPDENCDTHTVCIKQRMHEDILHGKGIRFQKSTYDEINSLAIDKDIPNINKYLDNTYGYYTLDIKHNFVLAHYNWHVFSNPSKSKGITDPSINIKNINDMMNRRIKRMFDMCNAAKYIFFIFNEENYNYMLIDDNYFDLHDLTELKNVVNDKFNAQSFVLKVNEVDSADKILDIINDNKI